MAWSRSSAFPACAPASCSAAHASCRAGRRCWPRDGSVLAESAARRRRAQSPKRRAARRSARSADAVLGTVGPVPPARRAELEEQGVPAQAIVGLSGLELALDARLRGTPGGELLAGSAVLAYGRAAPGAAVRTTVSPALQRAAVTALGGQYGGVVAMQPSTGQILAVPGIGLDGLQPPGSTFKMITVTGVLAAAIATRTPCSRTRRTRRSTESG